MNETSLLPDGSLQVGERLSQGSGPPNLVCVCVCEKAAVHRASCVCVCPGGRESKNK